MGISRNHPSSANFGKVHGNAGKTGARSQSCVRLLTPTNARCACGCCCRDGHRHRGGGAQCAGPAESRTHSRNHERATTFMFDTFATGAGTSGLSPEICRDGGARWKRRHDDLDSPPGTPWGTPVPRRLSRDGDDTTSRRRRSGARAAVQHRRAGELHRRFLRRGALPSGTTPRQELRRLEEYSAIRRQRHVCDAGTGPIAKFAGL